MMDDMAIAQQTKLSPIWEVARGLGLTDMELILPYGNYKAKLSVRLLEQIKERPTGKLILVTAITPTKFGEGKTTVSIGLSMALNRLDRRSIVVLRQPSLGPVFGISPATFMRLVLPIICFRRCWTIPCILAIRWGLMSARFSFPARLI